MSDKNEEENESSIKQATLLKQPDFNLISKLLWIDLSRKDFDLLIKVVDDNLNNKSYKTLFARHKYQKNSQNEARQLYNSLTKPDVNVLSKAKSRSKNKRENVVTVLNNIKMVVSEGLYFHYKNKSSKSEESIAKETN